MEFRARVSLLSTSRAMLLPSIEPLGLSEEWTLSFLDSSSDLNSVVMCNGQ